MPSWGTFQILFERNFEKISVSCILIFLHERTSSCKFLLNSMDMTEGCVAANFRLWFRIWLTPDSLALKIMLLGGKRSYRS